MFHTLLGRDTLPSTCYILSESNIAFYSSSNGYKKWKTNASNRALMLSLTFSYEHSLRL